MEKYEFTVKRTYMQDVYDTYNIHAENADEALEKIRAMLSSPAEMAIQPHKTYEVDESKYTNVISVHVSGSDIDNIYYNEELDKESEVD